MSLHRRALWLFILAVITFTVIVPKVRAQTTLGQSASSITDLQIVAVVGTDATVKVAVTYNLGATGHAVSISIVDTIHHGWATGTAMSSQNTCRPNTEQFVGQAYCIYIPASASGSDVLTFNLNLNSVARGMYALRAVVEVHTSNGQPISSASTYQDFAVPV